MSENHATLRTLEPEEEQFKNLIADLHALPNATPAEDFDYKLKQRIAASSRSEKHSLWKRFFFLERLFPLNLPGFVYGIVAAFAVLFISYFIFWSSDVRQHIDSIPRSEEQLLQEQPIPARKSSSDEQRTMPPTGSSSGNDVSFKREKSTPHSPPTERILPQNRRILSPAVMEKKSERAMKTSEEKEFLPSIRGIDIDQDMRIDSAKIKDSLRDTLQKRKSDAGEPGIRNDQRAR